MNHCANTTRRQPVWLAVFFLMIWSGSNPVFAFTQNSGEILKVGPVYAITWRNALFSSDAPPSSCKRKLFKRKVGRWKIMVHATCGSHQVLSEYFSTADGKTLIEDFFVRMTTLSDYLFAKSKVRLDLVLSVSDNFKRKKRGMFTSSMPLYLAYYFDPDKPEHSLQKVAAILIHELSHGYFITQKLKASPVVKEAVAEIFGLCGRVAVGGIDLQARRSLPGLYDLYLKGLPSEEAIMQTPLGEAVKGMERNEEGVKGYARAYYAVWDAFGGEITQSADLLRYCRLLTDQHPQSIEQVKVPSHSVLQDLPVPPSALLP